MVGEIQKQTDSDSAFNAFTANENVIIKAVSFFADADDFEYTIKVYKFFEGGELSDLQSTKTGFISHRGFHTIDLTTEVVINTDDNFYVFLFLCFLRIV